MIIHYKTMDDGRMFCNDGFTALLKDNGIDSAEKLWLLPDEKVKNAVRERGTGRCSLRDDGGNRIECYIKRYKPLPWREKFKNIICGKPYGFDAIHEWNALGHFLSRGFDTMLPMAAARLPDGRSCNLTLGITDYVRLADLLPQIGADNPERRRLIVKNVAEIVGRMHAAGMAHQDLYLVHFFVKPTESDRIWLIDLQRMIFQKRLAARWRIKDLAQLLFSAEPIVSSDEIALFWKIYSDINGLSPVDRKLIDAIRGKAARIRNHDRNRARRQAKKITQTSEMSV